MVEGTVYRRAAAALLCAFVAQNACALTIEFDYSYDTRGFFTDTLTGEPLAERRAMLDLAASFYSGFSNALSAVEPGDGDAWSVSFTHPSLGGPGVKLDNLSIAGDTLRIYVGGSPSAPGVLGFAGTGTVSGVSGEASFVNAVSTRGQGTVFASWGGYIWFNASNDWYFGADESGLGAGQPDFLTTATHEIGHILGFGEADSWFANIDPDSGLFVGPHSTALHDSGVPLDRYGSHWAEGTYSVRDGIVQETMMDPSTPFGQRQLPTALDYAGFADIGWQLSPVPEPGPRTLMLAGLAMLAAAAWRARRNGMRRTAFEDPISGRSGHGDRFPLSAQPGRTPAAG